jgi:hypothetical protein
MDAIDAQRRLFACRVDTSQAFDGGFGDAVFLGDAADGALGPGDAVLLAGREADLGLGVDGATAGSSSTDGGFGDAEFLRKFLVS